MRRRRITASLLSLLLIVNLAFVPVGGQMRSAETAGSGGGLEQDGSYAAADPAYGKDTYSFTNDYRDFFKDNAADSWKISESYLPELYSGMTNTEKSAIKAKMNQPWSGSGFGMSAVLALAYKGDLDPGHFQPGAKSLKELKAPKDSRAVFDLIQYYQLAELTEPVQSVKMGMADKSQIQRNKELVAAFENEKAPVLIAAELSASFEKNEPRACNAVGYDMKKDAAGSHFISVRNPDSGDVEWILEISSDYSAARMYEKGDYIHKGSSFRLKYFLGYDESTLTYNRSSPWGKTPSSRSLAAGRGQKTPGIQLTLSYAEFVVRRCSGGQVLEETLVSGGGWKEGGVDIYFLGTENEKDGKLRNSYALMDLTDGEYYEVSPVEIYHEIPALMSDIETDEEEYFTSFRRDDPENGFNVSVDSPNPGKVRVGSGGAVTTEYLYPGEQEISATINSAKTGWYTVAAAATDSSVTVEPVDTKASVYTQNQVKLDLALGNDFNTVEFEGVDSDPAGISVKETADSRIQVTNSRGDTLADGAMGYAVIFFTVGGSEVPGLFDVEPGSRIDQPMNPMRDGYSFSGWYRDMKYTAQWSFAADTVDGDMFLFAKWDGEKDIAAAELDLIKRDRYLSGYDDGTVRPTDSISRQEVASMLYNLLTDESREHFTTTFSDFNDMSIKSWSNTAVSSLRAAGIVSGYDDGSFGPDDPITRAELVTMVCNFYDVTDAPGSFSDTDGHWAIKSINYAAEKKWISGYPGDKFEPENAITRGETVSVLNAVTGRSGEDIELIEEMNTFPDNLDEEVWYYGAVQVAANTYELKTAGDSEEEV